MLPLRLEPETRDNLGRVMKMSKKERRARVQDPYDNTVVDGSAERKATAATGTMYRDITQVYFS